ncbi:MAG TPA: NAD-dependent epimerase/dehydratase family protein [Verrucomicrobiae bacterium]|nr:NAD-dependent epimerase/dehydratase family protein [Verrucomicrobiae bacterium]
MSRRTTKALGSDNGGAAGHLHSPATGVNSVNGHRGRPALITGGAGFIGTNLAARLLSGGKPVILFDNLSRAGVEQNLAWLQATYGTLVQFQHGDIRNREAVRRAVSDAGQVFHFAAQVAVTTSLEDPIDDFEINALGTLNLLEAIRSRSSPPPLIFTSTNKVYGHMNDVALVQREERYEPADAESGDFGFGESRALHFHSPYGCSKGAAEQYVLDYAKTFGLKTAVFRMSCIYGPHQFGNEDQGWVAHFLIRALNGEPITLYGDGRQVRDILFVEDLVNAFLLAQENISAISGQVFNIGGGPSNTTSLLELLNLISHLRGRAPSVRFDAWRPADQQFYVSDTRRFSEATGWAPALTVREGVTQLHDWLVKNRSTASSIDAVSSVRARHHGGVSLRKVPARRVPRLKRLPNGSGEPRETDVTLATAV